MNKKGITFNTLKIEGFGSIKDFRVFKLNELGLTIIRGENGTGKTTVLSALVWCLYGKLLKQKADLATWEHLRDSHWVGTRVSVTFFKGDRKYKITRCKDYDRVIGKTRGGNRIIVEEEGVPLDIKDKRDLQKKLEEILGISYDLFTTTVIYKQMGIQFLEQTGPVKKAILEESFKISWITLAVKKAKKDLQELASPLTKWETKLESTNQERDNLNSILRDIKKSKEEFSLQQTKKIAELNTELKTLKESDWELLDTSVDLKEKEKWEVEIGKLRGELEAMDSPSMSSISSMVVTQSTILSRIETLHKNIASQKALGDNSCPVCGSKLSDKKSLSLVESWLEELKAKQIEIATIKTKLRSLRGDAEKVEKKKEYISKAEKQLTAISDRLSRRFKENSEIEANKAKVSSLEKEIKSEELKKFNDPSPKLKERLQKLDLDKLKVEAKLAKVRRKEKLLKWAISDPLSNKGLKSFLFDQLLSKLNRRLLHYSKYTGIRVEVLVDMESIRKDIETVVFKKEAPVNYFSLSGGEMKVANAMVAMGAGDVLLAENPINLRFYDEITNMQSKKNIQVMADLFKAISLEYPVYVITHSPILVVDGATEITFEDTEDD